MKYFCTFILCVLYLRLAIERINENEWRREHYNELVKYFLVCVALICEIIPEGLPLSVTIALAISAKSMLTNNVLVR